MAQNWGEAFAKGFSSSFESAQARSEKYAKKKEAEAGFEEWKKTDKGTQALEALGLDPAKAKMEEFVNVYKYQTAATAMADKQRIAQDRNARMQMSLQARGYVPSTPQNFPQAMGAGQPPISIQGINGLQQYVKQPKPATTTKYNYTNTDALAKIWVKGGNIEQLKAYEGFKAMNYSPEKILKIMIDEGGINEEEVKGLLGQLGDFGKNLLKKWFKKG